MTHIVIIGGGAAGLPAAHELAAVAREDERITVVAPRSRFRVAPGTTWISAQSAPEFDLAQSLARLGVGFSAAGAQRIRPERRQLELGDGTTLDYDVLVIAAGPQPAFDAVQGLGPAGFTQSLCHVDHLAQCARTWKRFLADPGPIVVGAVQGATCLGPVYEAAFRMDSELRERKLRDRLTMTFVTPEPYVGHLGVGGIGDSRARLEGALAERDIACISHARVERIERASMQVAELDASGAIAKRRALAFAYSMMMPPFRGIDAVAGIPELADERGFIKVDAFLRNPRYPEIYAAGATVASAAAARVGEHRSAYVIDEMVNTVVRNIRDQIDGREPHACPTWSAVQLADLGAAGMTFIADPQGALGPRHGVGASDWVHMARCSSCDVGDGATGLYLR
jgi:sulfide:quinone oxidoreductase